jgi:hypothetical protein
MTSWCHGAPGIGLARLGSLAILDTPEIREEIAIALNTTLQFGLQNIDHPCCGNCGRMEVLLVAAQKLLRPDLVETAQKQASWVVARAKQVGGFICFPSFPKMFTTLVSFKALLGLAMNSCGWHIQIYCLQYCCGSFEITKNPSIRSKKFVNLIALCQI